MKLSIPLGELDFLGLTLDGPTDYKSVLSIPLGELDFLGLELGELTSMYGGQLSIPLGELDFLGPIITTHTQKIYTVCSFNSPWGIRFPWTGVKGNPGESSRSFQFPLGN